MHALIIANGTLPRRGIIPDLLEKADIVICADGGANHAVRLKLPADVILGDFDSITRKTLKAFPRATVIASKDQDSTDLEKALEFCLCRKIGSCDIIGATGSRIDHSTGSLGCFKKYGSRIGMRIIDTVGALTLIRKRVVFSAAVGEKISLIPLERCEGVTTKNLFYELHNEPLELGVREGISNQATGDEVTVSVKKGTLLLYRFLW